MTKLGDSSRIEDSGLLGPRVIAMRASSSGAKVSNNE